ncbi:hypothetical protein [Methylobacterium sp. A54F]
MDPGGAAFRRSLAPALERAFATEDASAFPEGFAELIARLHAGPLGSPAAQAEVPRAA